MNLAEKYALRDVPTLMRAVDLAPHRRVAVQAGGNRGVFAHRLASEFDHVYAFEPDPELFTVMSNRLARCHNVVRLQAAVGGEHDLVSPVRARRDGDPTRVVHEGVTHVVLGGFVPTLKIDDLGLEECDFICLDVEGYELWALVGGLLTITRCSPVIMIELNGSGKTLGLEDEDVRTWLRLNRYEMKFRERSDEVYVRR